MKRCQLTSLALTAFAMAAACGDDSTHGDKSASVPSAKSAPVARSPGASPADAAAAPPQQPPRDDLLPLERTSGAELWNAAADVETFPKAWLAPDERPADYETRDDDGGVIHR